MSAGMPTSVDPPAADRPAPARTGEPADGLASAPWIRTPDQRLRVFISSTLAELAPERAAAAAAVERLRLTPVLFELGARPHPPRALYRAYLEQSQVFVGIYWQRYGWVARDQDVSGIEDEYRLCGEKPRLVYVKTPAPEIDPKLAEFLSRIEETGLTSYRLFETATELGTLLADDLAVLLSEGFGWTRSGADAGGDPEPGVRRLPVPLTRLVDRERELRELGSRCADPGLRLLTVTGAGGTGKSRLAIEAARRLAGRFAGGAVFTDLAAVGDPELVVSHIARSLAVSPEGSRPLLEAVVERLRRRPALLVVDNFEQVAAAAPQLAAILAHCPEVQAIVTSRAPLHVRGEREYHAAPLSTPGSGGGPDEIAESPAVQLFVERAADAVPGFALTEENAPAVAEICRRLDGLPLALELAAARVRVLPPEALLGRLAGRLDLRAAHADLPRRQQTLRATLDWSHALLDEPERALFARLAVFAGGWTLAAAESVCGDDGSHDVVDTLSSLVEKSLVSVDAPNVVEPRFRMLRTVREYAAERLAERGERERVEERHALFFGRFCDEAGPHLYEREAPVWLARLDAELENLRASSLWARRHGRQELLARALAATALYWWIRDEIAGTRALLEEILPLPASASAQVRGHAAWMLGMCVAEQVERARTLFREAHALATEAGDAKGTALALSGLGAVAPRTDGPDGAWALHGAALEIVRRIDWRWGIAYVLHHFGDTAIRDGNGAAAITYGSECLEIARELENEQMTAIALWQLGWGHILESDAQAARGALRESAPICIHLRSAENMSYCLDGFAAVALADGKSRIAAQLAGAADAARARLRIAPFPPLTRLVEDVRTRARATLGDRAFAAEHARGRTISPEDALAHALAAPEAGAVGDDVRRGQPGASVIDA